MRERDETKLLGTFFTALLIGIGFAALFTPQSGRRTRKDLERFGRRTKDLVWDFQESIKESLDDLIEDVAEVTRESLEKGKAITEEQKKKILEMVESGESFLSSQKENLKKLFKID
jgi:gas vesicle protein